MTTPFKRPDITSTPMECFLSLPDSLENLCFLTSDASQGSRWSIVAWDASQVVSYDGKTVSINAEPQSASIREVIHQIYQQRKIKAGFTSPTGAKNNFPFIGGAIGAIDYEYGYELLGLPYENDGKPLVEYLFFDQALLYDHQESVWYQVGDDDPWSSRKDVPRRVSTEGGQVSSLSPTWDKPTYLKKFHTIHDNIRRGEIYQACLTFPFKGEPITTPRQAFAHFFTENPAPMAAYLELPSRTILSLSPEHFFTWDGKTLETKPIKGTRKRGKTDHQDRQLSDDLLADKKEQAELNMITDLLRNDLAKVSIPGSVSVLKHQALQKLPKVWHTFSHIQSQTKEGTQPWHIIEALFPGGSISGCPKRRAVELLADVEDSRRGIYTGCIGMLSDDGKMTQSIAIRTMEHYQDSLQCSFGGGIVSDSDANREYEECFAKSQTFSWTLPPPKQTNHSNQKTKPG